MGFRKKHFAIIFALLVNLNVTANRDSLLNIWNSTKPDSLRYEAILSLSESYIFTEKDSALLFFKMAETAAEKNTDKKWNLKVLKFMGRADYMWGDYKSSYEHFRLALNISIELNDKENISALYSNMATVLIETGDFDKALDMYKKSFALDLKSGNKTGIAITLNNMGIAYWNKGDLKNSIFHYQQSLKLSEELRDSMMIARNYNNLGIVHKEIRSFKDALNYFERSVALFDKLNDDRSLAANYLNIGVIYEEMSDLENALTYQLKALDLLLISNDLSNLSACYNNFGVIYEDLKQYQKSIEYHKKGLVIREAIGDKKGISKSKSNIGALLNKINKPDEAIALCNEALVLAEELKTIEEMEYACSCLYEGMKAKGDYNKALDFYEKMIAYRDSLSNYEQAREIAKKEAEFDYDKKTTASTIRNEEIQKVKDAQIFARDEQLKREVMGKYMLFGGLFLVLAFSGFLYNRIKITRKQKSIIETQKHIAEEQNKEILDSITYAKRIQEALLKNESSQEIKSPGHFIYYKPRDIISGDFYWKGEHGSWWYICVGDCTGHGVPGALLTMLGVSFMNEIINSPQRFSPAKLLNKLREKFVKELSQSGKPGDTQDGMDISLLAINKDTLEAEWAGANNSLWVFRNANDESSVSGGKGGLVNNLQNKISSKLLPGFNLTIHEFHPDKQPIGFYSQMNPFTHHQMQLKKSDAIYLFSDGLQDQFGGDNKKKLKISNVKNLLAKVSSAEINAQPGIINDFFMEWKGDLEQVDDVCVIGIRI